MSNAEMFNNKNYRPTQRKENKEIILKKIAQDVTVHEKEIERIKKEAHNAILLLHPDGKEIINIEESFDEQISKLKNEIEKLEKNYNEDYLETTLPLYLYEKETLGLKKSYQKQVESITLDNKRRQRILAVQTINRPKREFLKELELLENKHKATRKSIKKSPDLGKIAIAEELEFLDETHQKVVEELTLKYQKDIEEAEAKILTKEEIKPELDGLKLILKETLLKEKILFKEKINKLDKPDTKKIKTTVKALKTEFKTNKKALITEIKSIKKDKKAALVDFPRAELDKEALGKTKKESKQIKKVAKQEITKVKHEIKKIFGFRPRKLTYNRRKVLFGLIFVVPWLVGFVMLFVYPFIQSFYYSFYELTPITGGIDLKFVGVGNYIYAFQEHVFGDTSFKIEILNTLQDSIINLLVLVIFSLFIAVLLNHEFKGRAIIRAIFFIPVILNSSAVSIALSQGGTLTELLLEESAVGIFNLGDYLMGMGLGTTLISFVAGLIGMIYDIITLSGVPILLFLAAIQSVPKHLYEAATIEGATGYEQFWLITLPNVSPHIITVSIYAIVDTFLTSSVSTIITHEFNQQNWGLSSAMSWVYVALIIGILISLAILAKIFGIGEAHYEKER